MTKWETVYQDLCYEKIAWSSIIRLPEMSGPPWAGDVWRVIGMEIDNVSYVEFGVILEATNAK